MRSYALLVLLLAAGHVAAQEQTGDTPRTGIFATNFTERSLHSDFDRMTAVSRWDREQLPEYDVADHTFQLVVPDGYDGSESYGLLVFIHPNNEVRLNQFYGRHIADELADRNLIWVSFSGAGNPVMSNIRLGLALDAVHNVSQQYAIDESRVYVSGMSGGGRISCMAGIYYPQVFTGCIPIVGSLYFREVPVPEDPQLRALIRADRLDGQRVWPQQLLEPSASRLRSMVRSQAWVLLAGEQDFNMPEMRSHFEHGFERDGFERAHYLEVPGMGHQYPPAESFAQALDLLQEPLEQAEDAPPADERIQRAARNRLAAALRVLERDAERGGMLLERLINAMPNTEAAAEARERLHELRSAP